MRRILLGLTMLLGFAAATAPLSAAQNDVDVEGIGKRVAGADPQALLEALKAPIADDYLPDGFAGAEYAAPETAQESNVVARSETFPSAVGNVTYTVSYDPASGDGAEATPEVDLSSLSLGLASLNYFVLDDEITSDRMADLKKSVEASIAIGATPEAGAGPKGVATVEDIQIGGTDALLLTYISEQAGVQSAAQMIIIPVGNVMVVSMAMLASPEIDVNAMRTDAEDLALAGVEHLGAAAETAP